MRTPIWRAARVIHNHTWPQPCRFIVGRRFPLLPRRTFHSSLSQRREDDPASTPEATWNHIAETGTPISDPYDSTQEVESGPEGGIGAPQKPPRPTDRSYYGSGIKRANRGINKKKEIPPFHIPQWFMDRNVILRESCIRKVNEAGIGSPAQHHPTKAPNKEGSVMPTTSNSISDVETKDSETTADENSSAPTPDLDDEGLPLGDQIVAEISTLVSAGLQVPTREYSHNWTSPKPHLVLHCPKDGGTPYLDKLVKGMMGSHATDLIKLDAQDLAQIGSDYLEDPNRVSQSGSLSLLGYDAHLMATSGGAEWIEDPEDVEEDDEAEDEDDRGRPKPISFPKSSIAITPLASFAGIMSKIPRILSSSPQQPSSSSRSVRVVSPPTEKDLKMGIFIETLIDACEIKRRFQLKGESDHSTNISMSEDQAPPKDVSVEQATENEPFTTASSESRSLIIHIEDYPEINATFSGGKVLDKVHEIVQRRRKEGQKILIIGTTSSRDLIPSISEAGFKSVQSQQERGPTRTIVTPLNVPESKLESDIKCRTRLINQRNLQDMLRRLTTDPALVSNLVAHEELELASSAVFLSEMDLSVWSLDRVHRAATTALGSLTDGAEMTTKHIEDALALIELSDSKKFEWAAKESEMEKAGKDSRSLNSIKLGATMSSDESEQRMKRLRRTCNKHEKKLLNGVVDPESIRTTFADVRAPPATIDALKNLTSLSLVRPDAFTYGVLATDRIPGLLLYGPPGTGKTLLAKAVAKESGATVLEVSGSDVYDMYVGEGEKNIRAIFSLAKKLTPCIVFIDEADAILGSRSGSSNRTSHRELINQFLREWDGMNDMSAFIMVATNRPFDLDEASLRRLPRRLLVDLPVEKDREEILKIHLKDELLDPSVSLSALASQTPFYSGSDLKNLAVAAALACVREEFDVAKTASEEHKYPEKRTLHERHFKMAMEEISASVSEDMGSLSAIRKFDEKYGDRRGRRKKSGYGFLTVQEGERAGSDAARVRNQS